jgi:predicted MFS family arabinose efflux permease
LSRAATPELNAKDAPRHAVGYLQLLRGNRSFRWLFAARSISLLGDWFNTLALFALLDQMRGESARSFGWVLILKLAPLLLMAPAAGVVADRFNRKRVMIWTDVLRAVVVIGFLLLARWPRLDLLLGLTFVQISLSAFFEPARSAAVAQICSRDELLAANALMAVTWSIMLTVGAAIGGIASHLFGWQTAILLDAATYVASAFLIVPIRLAAVIPKRRRVGFWHALGFGDAVDGFRFMRHNPGVATMVCAKGAWGVGGALTLMLTLFGQVVYPVLGSPVLGMTLFYSARGLGTAFGPILSRRLAGHSVDAMHVAISVSFGVAACFYFAFGFVHLLPLAALFVILAHLGGATIWVFSTVLIQRAVPHAFQGRVFAAEMALFTLTFSLSTWLFGSLRDAAAVDLHTLMRWLAGGILLAGMVWSLAARTWPLRGESAPEPEPGGRA